MEHEQRTVDRIVRGGVPLLLETPPHDATSATISRVLVSVGVHYGLEHAPAPEDLPPIDFGRAPDRVVTLNGLRLGDALDAIVREDPRYEWSEEAGRILVRLVAMGGQSALDARIRRFTVDAVTFVDALAALIRAIDPARSRPTTGGGEIAFEIGANSREMTSAAPDTQRVSVDMQDATVLAILETIARRHGSLSWTVSYSAQTLSLASVSLAFQSGLAFAHAGPAVAAARPGLSPVRIPPLRMVDGRVLFYTRHARIPVAIELIAEPLAMGGMDGQLIDLSGATPPEAIARLVALDSRYQWGEADGIFWIRPVAAASGSEFLSREVEGFAVSTATVESALSALVHLLHGTNVSTGEGTGGLFGVERAQQERRIAAARVRRFSLTMGRTTARQVLNAIVREHGAMSWVFRPQPMPHGQPRLEITLDGFDGWSISRTFSLAPR